jgi:hypothetical protein
VCEVLLGSTDFVLSRAVCEVLFGANACGLIALCVLDFVAPIALCVLEKPASFELVFEIADLDVFFIIFPY